jgi:hypothetical protein
MILQRDDHAHVTELESRPQERIAVLVAELSEQRLGFVRFHLSSILTAAGISNLTWQERKYAFDSYGKRFQQSRRHRRQEAEWYEAGVT